MLKPCEEKYLQYFDRSVLNHYRANSHMYTVIEDDIGGQVRVSDNWDESEADKFPYIELHFGFRKLEDDTTCIVIFMPSFINKTTKEDIDKWLGFKIKNPTFKKEDSSFTRWIDRYLHGSWDVEDGPKVQIERSISLISSLTKYSIGIPLFKYDRNILLNYPLAENSEEYAKAILELYRLVIDGMQNDAIVKIAEHLAIDLTDETKRLNSLKEILPPKKRDTIHFPLKELSIRRKPIHTIPKDGVKKMSAFAKFNDNLHKIACCLSEMLSWLEEVFNVEAKSCKERDESLMLFPELTGHPRPSSKLADIQKCVGKRIKSVKFGEEKEHEEVHQREGIIINFDDGTSMAIRSGSNAYNLHSQYGIKPTEFHTDLMIFWADSIKKVNAKRLID